MPDPVAPLVWAAPLVPGADEARRWAEQELARQVYQDAKPGLADLIWSWLAETFGALLDGAGHLDAGVAMVLLALLVLAAALLVLRRFRFRAPTEPASADVFDAGGILTAAEHRQRAAGDAARGDFRTACREVFRALVRSGEERAVLDLRPGRTADEAAEELVRAFPDFSSGLRQAAGLFDAVTYGGEPATQRSYGQLLKLDSVIRQSLPRQHGVGGSHLDPSVANRPSPAGQASTYTATYTGTYTATKAPSDFPNQPGQR